MILYICLSVSALLHWVWQSLGPSMLLQTAFFCSFLWLIFLCIYVPHLLYPFICWWTFRLLPYLGNGIILLWTLGCLHFPETHVSSTYLPYSCYTIYGIKANINNWKWDWVSVLEITEVKSASLIQLVSRWWPLKFGGWGKYSTEMRKQWFVIKEFGWQEIFS